MLLERLHRASWVRPRDPELKPYKPEALTPQRLELKTLKLHTAKPNQQHIEKVLRLEVIES